MASIALTPIPRDRFGFLEAQHLLNRAGFGGSAAQVQSLVSMGPLAAVDYLLDYDKVEDDSIPEPQLDPDVMRPLSRVEQREMYSARQRNDEAVLARYRALRNQAQAADRRQLPTLRQWWLNRLVQSPRPLQEKLVLLWHSHFAVHYRGCEDTWLLYQQNRMFRANAMDFAALARNIVRDPAMLIFLNNDRNNRREPNENLARELMELFTLGEGNYTETDIKEGARALTGYTCDDNVFYFDRDAHDTATKSILGSRGAFDGDDFVNLCLDQPACARFVAYKLYKHFVADVPKLDQVDRATLGLIDRLAVEIRRSRYNLRPALRELLLSERFYDPAVRGTKIKSPVQLAVGLVRVLDTPLRQPDLLADAMRRMGQELFNPPNVAGWPGGRTWINTATLFIRQNLATYLITGRPPYDTGWTRQDIDYDPMPLVQSVQPLVPAGLVDHLSMLLMGSAATDQRRKQLLDFLARHDNRITPDVTIALLCLITAMPEFQLC